MFELDIMKKLDRIEQLTLLASKEVLDIKEVAMYSGYSVKTIYAMVGEKMIPCYKPSGGKLFFKKSEITDFLLTGKQESIAEMVNRADSKA